jgi:uncharacterized protein (TIGR00251 family)
MAVHAKPSARTSSIAPWIATDAAVEIRVAAPPIEGRANEELVSYLDELLGHAARDVAVCAGSTGRNKLVAFTFTGSIDDLLRRLAPE